MKSHFKFSSQESVKKREKADVLILPFWQEKKAAAAFKSFSFLKDDSFKQAINTGDFLAKEGQCVMVYSSKEKEERFLLLGLGKKSECSTMTLRKASSSAIGFCKGKKIKQVNFLLPVFPKLKPSRILQLISEAVASSIYMFSENKKDTLKDESLCFVEEVCFIGASSSDAILKRTIELSKGMTLTRNLINRNADDVTPEKLAEVAKSFEKVSSKIKTVIFNKKRIESEKMGYLLAVNKGSHLEPRFIIISYKGNPKSKEHVALIGKGITYDTGGLSLKPSDFMLDMRSDMGGAATVLGTVYAAALLKLKMNITVVIPSSENPIDSKSYKVGDVYKGYSGKTTEVTNTDAEGRLVLADAISYTVKNLKPKCIIDLATLTGGVVIALGTQVAGFFSNSENLAKGMEKASKNTDELLWRLPLYPDYMKLLKSDVADIKNSAGREASSIQGALFLQAFVEKTPWVHVDIAGTAFLNKPEGYLPSLATGYGVRLLIDFLESFSFSQKLS